MEIGIQGVPKENELEKLIDKLFDVPEDVQIGVRPISINGHRYPQVIFYNDDGNRIADAVCHPFSYGHEQGLIEVMGYPLCRIDDDDVEGWLTADTVFSRWMEWLKERG